MAKRKSSKVVRDKFAQDEIEGEYEKPGPRVDPDAKAISEGLSKLANRPTTGFVTSWLPKWGKRAKIDSFAFFFFEDRLAVDMFGRDREEMDALNDDFTLAQRAEIAAKTFHCGENGIRYLVLGPDDELDMTQLAAKIGKTTFKRGQQQARPKVGSRATGDGISEEEL